MTASRRPVVCLMITKGPPMTDMLDDNVNEKITELKGPPQLHKA